MGSAVTVMLVYTLTAAVCCACCAAAGIHMLSRPQPRRARGAVGGTGAEVVVDAHAGAAACSMAVDVAREVEMRAVALDRELVAAGRVRLCGQRPVVRDLRGEVGQLEALNQRPVSTARTNRSRTDLSAERERLDALDAAMRELALEPPAAGTPA